MLVLLGTFLSWGVICGKMVTSITFVQPGHKKGTASATVGKRLLNLPCLCGLMYVEEIAGFGCCAAQHDD